MIKPVCPKCGSGKLVRDLDVVERAPIVGIRLDEWGPDPVFSENPEEYEYFEAEDNPFMEYVCTGCFTRWGTIDDFMEACESACDER